MRRAWMTAGLLHPQTPTDSRRLMILRALLYDEAGFARSLLLLAHFSGRNIQRENGEDWGVLIIERGGCHRQGSRESRS